jgi:hypothetical protein
LQSVALFLPCSLFSFSLFFPFRCTQYVIGTRETKEKPPRANSKPVATRKPDDTAKDYMHRPTNHIAVVHIASTPTHSIKLSRSS